MAPDVGLELSLCASAVAERFIESPKAAAGARWREVLEGLVRGLEEEQGKIEAFKRELPFCVRIIADAVEILKRKLEQREVEKYKQTEELFPLEENGAKMRGREKENDNMDKKNWMSSVQLWNDNNVNKFEKENKKIFVEPKSAFTPFKCPAPITITRSNEETTDLSLQSSMSIHAQHQHSPRKARRCWSEHLHRLFLYAMEQLGGPHGRDPPIPLYGQGLLISNLKACSMRDSISVAACCEIFRAHSSLIDVEERADGAPTILCQVPF